MATDHLVDFARVAVPLAVGGLVCAWFGHHAATFKADKEHRLRKLEELWQVSDRHCWTITRHYRRRISALKRENKELKPLDIEDSKIEAIRETYTRQVMLVELYFPELKLPLEQKMAPWKFLPSDFSTPGLTRVEYMEAALRAIGETKVALKKFEQALVHEAKRIRSEGLLQHFLQLLGQYVSGEAR